MIRTWEDLSAVQVPELQGKEPDDILQRRAALALLGGFEASPSKKETPARNVQATRRKQRA